MLVVEGEREEKASELDRLEKSCHSALNVEPSPSPTAIGMQMTCPKEENEYQEVQMRIYSPMKHYLRAMGNNNNPNPNPNPNPLPPAPRVITVRLKLPLQPLTSSTTSTLTATNLELESIQDSTHQL
jgi:hypothetical protein